VEGLANVQTAGPEGPRKHRSPGFSPALAHARQPKVLVLEFESFDGILSPKDQGIFIFDKPFKVLALFQLNRVG
jgi:hypothetical protein